LERDKRWDEKAGGGCDGLDGAKAFLEDVGVEQPLAPALGLHAAPAVLRHVDDQVAVEDRLAIGLVVIDAVETDDAAVRRHSDRFGNGRQSVQRRHQHGRLALGYPGQR
jgi:hypothetical protein